MNRTFVTALAILCATQAAACVNEGGEPAPRAALAATSSFTESLGGVRAAYDARDSRAYKARVRALHAQTRTLAPAAAAARLKELVAYANANGWDGFEAVFFALQDAAARGSDAATVNARAAAAGALPAKPYYKRAAAMQLSQPVSRWHTRWQREVRGDALRAMFQKVAAIAPATRAKLGLAEMTASTAASSGLCGVPLRPGADGKPAPAEAIRWQACKTLGVPAGDAVVEDLCAKYRAGSLGTATGYVSMYDPASATEGASKSVTASSVQSAAKGGLAALCALDGATMPGELGSTSLDAWVTTECLGSTTSEVLAVGVNAQLWQDCLDASSGGSSNPFADEGGNPQGGSGFDPNTPGLYEWYTGWDDEGNPTGVEVVIISWDKDSYIAVASVEEGETIDDARKRAVETAAEAAIESECKSGEVCDPTDEPPPEEEEAPPPDDDEEEPEDVDGVPDGDGESVATGEEPWSDWDMTDPACQELANRGLLNGKPNLLSGLSERDLGRYINPSPDGDGPTANADAEPICGAPAEQTQPSSCKTPVLCAEQSALDATTCTCKSTVAFAQPSRNCGLFIQCADGNEPDEATCTCGTPYETSNGDRPPIPFPDPDPAGGGG